MIYSKGKNIERPHVSGKITDYVACLQDLFCCLEYVLFVLLIEGTRSYRYNRLSKQKSSCCLRQLDCSNNNYLISARIMK